MSAVEAIALSREGIAAEYQAFEKGLDLEGRLAGAYSVWGLDMLQRY